MRARQQCKLSLHFFERANTHEERYDMLLESKVVVMVDDSEHRFQPLQTGTVRRDVVWCGE